MASDGSLDELVCAYDGLSELIKPFESDICDVNRSHTSTNITSYSLEETHYFAERVDRFLDDVSALAKARDELISIGECFSQAKMRETSATLTHPSLIGQYIDWCGGAEVHMRSIIENKDLLIYHLQQPLITNFLTMHHQYHKDLISIIGDLVDVVNSIPALITLVEEHSQSSILKRSDIRISSVARTAAELRNNVKDITTLQTLVSDVLAGTD